MEVEDSPQNPQEVKRTIQVLLLCLRCLIKPEESRWSMTLLQPVSCIRFNLNCVNPFSAGLYFMCLLLVDRFRRDAANLLDILSAYQKRQIVEFLPYHHCDTTHQSPDLNCLMELQARYTQYRHTVLLTGTYMSGPLNHYQ